MTETGFHIARWQGGALPEDIFVLREAARAEGYRFLDRLEAECAMPEGVFATPPGRLLFGFDGTAVVGIGGLTADPYDPAPGRLRLRHVYVRPEARRMGVARLLVARLVADGDRIASHLTLRASNAAACRFWEMQGFRAVAHPNRSHERFRL